jgi:hypothetical protein
VSEMNLRCNAGYLDDKRRARHRVPRRCGRPPSVDLGWLQADHLSSFAAGFVVVKPICNVLGSCVFAIDVPYCF